MKIKLLICIAFLLFCASAYVQAQDRAILNEATRISGDRFSYSVKTAKGASVYAVSRPSRQMLNAIDKGLDDLFTVARKNGYRNRLSHKNYNIYIAKADRTVNKAGNYSPDIAVGAAQYKDSKYDQGGFIYAAGIVIGLSPESFMIAEHTKQFNRVSEAVRNEGEHLVLYHNDRDRYNQTADHSRGGGHPILN